MAPVRLSLESSFLAAGAAGFPVRGGLLFSYRPNAFLGFGLHADTNFSDHVSGTARLEAIWPAHRYFHLEGAFELGVRALLGQSQDIQGQMRPLSGAAFTFGGEIAASIPFSDFFGVSAFARFFYSPGGGFSTPAFEMPDPARGVGWNGGEVIFGFRVDIYPPVGRRHRADGSSEEVAPRRPRREPEAPPAPREALRALESSVDDLLRETPEVSATPDTGAARPEGDAGSRDAASTVTADASSATGTDAGGSDAATGAADREALLALQREIQTLTGSVSALETEITAATQILNDLAIGQEAGQPFYIRLDSLYDRLTARPPELSVEELTSFISDFRQALHDSDQLRLLVQSSGENFGPSILGNLGVFQTALQRYQRTLPVRASGDETARATLDAPLAQLGALIQEIQVLRTQPQSTEPPASQVSLWRVRLARVRERVDELAPSIGSERAAALEENFHRLESSFDTLLGTMEDARRNWLVSRALYSHYQALRSATRPTQAEAAIRGMLEELRGAPESYRRLRSRNVHSLRIVLEAFIQQRSAHPAPAWNTARDLAIEAMHWIDPAYTPPPVAAPATGRRRRRGSGETGDGDSRFRFPATGGAGRGRGDE
ncbi:MAG: hypothetical protein IT572_04860 [Deltaproteobacteria bacterium]|nr:hypothetical protein [Deltaproteobacteria bacterium]